MYGLASLVGSRLILAAVCSSVLLNSTHPRLVAAPLYVCMAAAHSGAGQSTQNVVTILNSLWQQLTGTEPPRLPPRSASQPAGARQSQEAAAQQLLLCEVAMRLFERERAPEGAAMFARAALQHLPAACDAGSSDGAAAVDGLTTAASSADTLQSREGRLWGNIFSYAVDQGAWEDAYAALVSNPIPERSLECLRRLVHELCERGEVLVLCALPLAGSLMLAQGEPGSMGTGGPTMVPLLGEAVAALQRRALNSDLSTVPRPYK